MKDIKYKENIVHGTMFYPFQCYDMYGEENQLMVSIHWHEEQEWIYVVEGKLEIQIDHTTLTITKGEMVVIASQAIHQMVSINKCHYYAFVFQLSFLDFKQYDSVNSKYLQPLLQGKQIIEGIMNISHSHQATMYMHQIIDVYKEECVGWEMEIKALLMLMIVYFHKSNHVFVQESEEGNRTLKTIYSYLHGHYHEKIFLHDIAFQVHLNEQYMCRYFKIKTGKNIVQYINEYRIEKACERLEHSEESVLDIAYQCGFDNFSYFISKFKSLKHMTPLKYRHQHVRCV